MAYRFVTSESWDTFDEEDWTPEERFVFLFICTSQFSRPCGLFRCTIKAIMKATGYDGEKVLDVLRLLEERESITYEAPLVFVKNYARFQRSTKMKGWEGHLRSTRDELCKNGNRASLAFESYYFSTG